MDYFVFGVYAVLILLLVWMMAFLIGRANDDDQWPQG